MASRYHWRQRLLGSLQGQLQLATYLVVFLGFTGASSVGLLIGQRNLLANDQQLGRQSEAEAYIDQIIITLTTETKNGVKNKSLGNSKSTQECQSNPQETPTINYLANTIIYSRPFSCMQSKPINQINQFPPPSFSLRTAINAS